MNIKHYNCFKTAKKTAKENGLVISPFNSKILFDFSLLETMQDPEAEEIIMQDSFRDCGYVSINREAFYGKCNSFTSYSGIATFYNHRIFTRNGNKAYNILELANIKHNKGVRDSLWDSFTVTSEEYDSGTLSPMMDVEL